MASEKAGKGVKIMVMVDARASDGRGHDLGDPHESQLVQRLFELKRGFRALIGIRRNDSDRLGEGLAAAELIAASQQPQG
jgi:hypothetical protein